MNHFEVITHKYTIINFSLLIGLLLTPQRMIVFHHYVCTCFGVDLL